MMKKRYSQIVSVFVLLIILVMMAPTSFATSATGLAFSNQGLGTYESVFEEFPLPSTYEATVYFPADFSGNGGVIIGNFVSMGTATAALFLEVSENGAPTLYITDKTNFNRRATFDQVNVFNGKYTHIAITVDHATKTWSCYIDGELKQTFTKSAPEPFVFESKFRLGGDYREDNEYYFKGILSDARFYSDVRTAQEIAADAAGAAVDMDNLICAYDLSNNTVGNYPETISSATAGYDFESDWVLDVSEPQNYAYSFAVIGDIQTMTRKFPSDLPKIYEWIRDNAESKNIKFAVSLGDITDHNTEEEYQRVVQAYELIDGVVPFSLIRGNHDGNLLGSEMYDTYITQEKYGDEITGAYDATMHNTYRILEVGSVKYLFMNLDYLLKDEVIAWANEIIAANPECHVIVSTHIYVNAAGSYLELSGNGLSEKYGCENNGEVLWDRLLSKHENIVMMLCGHVPTDDIFYRQKTGDKGNVVTEILIDPQTTDTNNGGTGLVAMFYFSEDGKQLQVRYYSTVRNAYFRSNNQFTLELDVPESQVAPPEDPGAETPAPEGNWEIIVWIAAAVAVCGAGVAFVIVKKRKK